MATVIGLIIRGFLSLAIANRVEEKGKSFAARQHSHSSYHQS